MRYVIADVFTDAPFGGNQLAVFTDARDIPEEWLQKLTREFNFSETVFVYPPDGPMDPPEGGWADLPRSAWLSFMTGLASVRDAVASGTVG